MLNPNIKELNKLLRYNKIDEAIELYVNNIYYAELRNDGKMSFKKYIDKHFMNINSNIKILSSIAFVFVDDDRFINEYTLINNAIKDILDRKTIFD